MKKIRILLFFSVLAVAALVFFGSPALAQSKIAIVDVEALLTTSKAGKSIQDQLVSKQEAFRKEMQAKQKSLREEEQRLVKMRAEAQEKGEEVSSEFTEGKDQFSKDLMAAQDEFKSRRENLQKAARGAMSELRKQILLTVSALAEDQGYDVVLTKQNVVLAANDLDITEAVLVKLDKAVKKIKVEISDK